MKKLILLLLCMATFSACSSSDDTPAIDKDEKGLFFLTSYEKYELQSGEEKERYKDIHLLYIWEADGKDYDLYSNASDILKGFLYDKETGISEEQIRWGSTKDIYQTKLTPGEYVIVVFYDDGNKSYTYFNIEANKTTEFKKYYKKREVGQSYSEW